MPIQRNQFGAAFSAQMPSPIYHATQSSNADAVVGEAVTLITGAAGFRRTVRLDNAPIMNKTGDSIGSFWRQEKNIVDSSDYGSYSLSGVLPSVTSLTETATAADLVIANSQINMEQLFDSPAAPYDYVIVVQDSLGGTLAGWIGAITASGDAYTLSIFNGPSSVTQSWVGDLAAFDNTLTMRYQIFKYDTSFAWVTGTILTTEIAYNPNRSDEDQLRGFAQGEYAIDYPKGRILYRKATTGTSDTCNYTRRIGT